MMNKKQAHAFNDRKADDDYGFGSGADEGIDEKELDATLNEKIERLNRVSQGRVVHYEEIADDDNEYLQKCKAYMEEAMLPIDEDPGNFDALKSLGKSVVERLGKAGDESMKVQATMSQAMNVTRGAQKALQQAANSSDVKEVLKKGKQFGKKTAELSKKSLKSTFNVMRDFFGIFQKMKMEDDEKAMVELEDQMTEVARTMRSTIDTFKDAEADLVKADKEAKRMAHEYLTIIRDLGCIIGCRNELKRRYDDPENGYIAEQKRLVIESKGDRGAIQDLEAIKECRRDLPEHMLRLVGIYATAENEYRKMMLLRRMYREQSKQMDDIRHFYYNEWKAALVGTGLSVLGHKNQKLINQAHEIGGTLHDISQKGLEGIEAGLEAGRGRSALDPEKISEVHNKLNAILERMDTNDRTLEQRLEQETEKLLELTDNSLESRAQRTDTDADHALESRKPANDDKKSTRKPRSAAGRKAPRR